MAKSMNMFIIAGNLTRDAELKYTPKNTAVTAVNIAVNRSVKEGENWVDKVTFLRLIAWQKTAEFISKYLHKGDKALFRGRIDNRSYDKDGATIYVTELIIEDVVPMNRPPQPAGQAQQPSQPAPVKKPPTGSDGNEQPYPWDNEFPNNAHNENVDVNVDDIPG